MKVSEMKVNGKEIDEAKLNNKIVYRKQSSILLKNIIYNADFRYGTEGYKKFVNMVVQDIEDGWVSWTKMDSTNNRTSMIVQFTEDLIADHYYYQRVTFKGSEKVFYQWEQQLNSPNITNTYGQYGPEEVTLSTVSKVTTQYRLFYNMRATFSDENAKAYLKEPMLVDVTELINQGMSTQTIENQLNQMDFFADS